MEDIFIFKNFATQRNSTFLRAYCKNEAQVKKAVEMSGKFQIYGSYVQISKNQTAEERRRKNGDGTISRYSMQAQRAAYRFNEYNNERGGEQPLQIEYPMGRNEQQRLRITGGGWRDERYGGEGYGRGDRYGRGDNFGRGEYQDEDERRTGQGWRQEYGRGAQQSGARRG